MNRRGFVLLTVLWVVTVVSVLAGVALAVARSGAWTTRNRMLLARSAWARNACEEILQARYAEDQGVRVVDTVDLGRGTWCRAALENAAERVDVNLASPEMIRALVGVDSLTDALVERRATPFAAVDELRRVPGFDSALVARLNAVFTTRGAIQVDLNVASSEILRALPGMTIEAVGVILDRRRIGRRLGSADELVSLLDRPARDALLARYQDFLHEVAFAAPRYVALVEGGVHGTPIRCRAWLTLVPAGARLAVIRREAE